MPLETSDLPPQALTGLVLGLADMTAGDNNRMVSGLSRESMDITLFSDPR